MTSNRLAVTEFVKVYGDTYGDTFRSANTSEKPTQAFIYAHGVRPEKPVGEIELPTGKPDMAFLVPDGYILYAAKGQLSDYQQSERFDLCRSGQRFEEYDLLPVDDLGFSEMDERSFQTLAADVHFDVIILRKACRLSELMAESQLVAGYESVDLHCGRLANGSDVAPKYFLPMNTSAYLIQKSEPVSWHRF